MYFLLELIDIAITWIPINMNLNLPSLLFFAPFFLLLITCSENEVRFINEDVTIETDNPSVVLSGTLSVPVGSGSHPGILFLTGSGGHTRDQVISGFPMFKAIGDHLASQGFVVLRVDDRGEGESTGPNVRSSTTEDRAADAQVAFEFLKSRIEVEGRKIGILGHSEGTHTGAILASNNESVQFLVLLSPYAISGAELWAWQQGEILRQEGDFSGDKIKSIESTLFGMVNHIGNEGNTDEGFFLHAKEACLAWGDPPELITEEFMTEAFGDLRQSWYEHFFSNDPSLTYSKVKKPLLAIFGSEDLQTPVQMNIGPLTHALNKAGNKNYTISLLPDEDHFFMSGDGLAPNEHVHGKMTFSSKAMETISAWLINELGL